jgi:hypothetical protein
MSLSHKDKRTVAMQYLLGSLSEEEKTKLEEQCFSDDVEFEELEIAEDELIDSYVRDELSHGDRKRFEDAVRVSARLSERVNFARLFSERTAIAVDRTPLPATPSRSWLNFIFGHSVPGQRRLRFAFAASLIPLIAGLVLTVSWFKLRDANRNLTAERTRIEKEKADLRLQLDSQKSRMQELSSELQTEINERQSQEKLVEELQAKSNIPKGSTALIALVAGTVRGGSGANHLVINKNTTLVKLTMNLGPVEYSMYGVSITTPEGNVVYRTRKLRSPEKSGNTTITVQFGARLLSAGDYIIRVQGFSQSGATEPAADYSLRVEKR